MQMYWILIIPWMVFAIAVAIVPIVIMLRIECRELGAKARVAPSFSIPTSTYDSERIPVGSGV